MLLGTGPAWAVTRYAAPGGTAPDTVCQSPTAPPCSIGTAAGGTNVLPADEAVIMPGNYSETGGDLGGDTGSLATTVEAVAGNIHGVPGGPRPVIVLDGTGAPPFDNNGFGAFILGGTRKLSHVEITTGPGSTATSNLTLQADAVVERVIARSSTNNALVCNNMQGTIRDSACLSSGSGATAVGASVGTAVSSTNNLRNVTAVSTGSSSFGLNYFYSSFDPNSGPTYVISAKSVIAQGTSQDVRAQAGQQTSTTINLDHSNYDTATTQVTGTGGAAAVTPPGTGAPNFNVTDPPLLGTDGYHQLAGSPTIDAGATDGSSGMTDIDGQVRTFGSAADIGADEVADADGDGLLDTADNCPNQAGPASNGGCPLAVATPPLSFVPQEADPCAALRAKLKKAKSKKKKRKIRKQLRKLGCA